MTAAEAQEIADYYEGMSDVASVSVGMRRDGTYMVLITYTNGQQQEL